MPISFCSSSGFKMFMAVVEPNYTPCKEEAIKKRLNGLKVCVKEKIEEDLNTAVNISCTSDCWSSITQESYLTVTANIIDADWNPKSYTLTTHGMDKRHTAENLAEQLDMTLRNWNIRDKVTAFVTDNAKNIVNSIALLNEDSSNIESVKCAAHTLQLAVNSALQNIYILEIVKKCSSVVGHFKYSNVAKKSLQQKQAQLGLVKHTLIQSSKTRWNSIYLMMDRLLENRCAVTNVIGDRTVTSASTAKILEILEWQWVLMESLVKCLKPIHIVTTLLSSQNSSPVSIVRPLIQKLNEKHFNPNIEDDELIQNFKNKVDVQLKRRFYLEWDPNMNNG